MSTYHRMKSTTIPGQSASVLDLTPEERHARRVAYGAQDLKLGKRRERKTATMRVKKSKAQIIDEAIARAKGMTT